MQSQNRTLLARIRELASDLERNRRWGILLLLAAGMAVQLFWILIAPSVDRSAGLFGDEKDYWLLADQGLRNLVRPFGYPALVRATMAVTPDSTVALATLQMLMAGAMPAAAWVLASALGLRLPAVGIAVLTLIPVSFTSATLSRRVLADPPLALFLLAAVLAAVATRQRPKAAFVASLFFGLALTLKPIVVVPLLVVAFWMTFGIRPKRLAAVLVALLCTAPLLVYLEGTVRNRWKAGVSQYSAISTQTVHRYWVPLTLTLAQTDGRLEMTRFEELKREWSPIGVRSDPELAVALEARNPAAHSVLRENPKWALRALLVATWRNLPRPFHPHELIPLARLESRTAAGAKLATYTLWLLAVIGSVRLVGSSTTRAAGLLLSGLFLSWLAASAVSFTEGARLLYPVEWVLFLFGACAFQLPAQTAD